MRAQAVHAWVGGLAMFIYDLSLYNPFCYMYIKIPMIYLPVYLNILTCLSKYTYNFFFFLGHCPFNTVAALALLRHDWPRGFVYLGGGHGATG